MTRAVALFSLAFWGGVLAVHFVAGFAFTENIIVYLLLLSVWLLSVLLIGKQTISRGSSGLQIQQNSSLEDVAHICQVLIWRLDESGVFTHIIGWQGVNDEVDTADLVGRHFSVVAEDYPEFYAVLLRAQKDGGEFVGHSYFEDRFYQHSVTPIINDDGLESGFQCVSLDVTEDQRIYNRLAFTEQVIASAAEAVIIFNRRRKLVSVNQAFTRITGYSRDDLSRGTADFQLIQHLDYKVIKQVLGELKHEGRWVGEMALRRRSGEQFAANVSLSVIRDTGGAVTHYAVLFSDLSYMKRNHEELRYLATHDNLTNLPNRRLFLDRLGHGILGAKRANRQLAVFFIDLDNFKLINDSFGHHFGDALLQEISRRLRSVVRQSDTVARLAGDEFTVMAENIHDLAEVIAIAEKILSCFSNPFNAHEQLLEATASVGIAIYPDDGLDLETIMKQADEAMYRAKASGRNGYFSLHGEEANSKAVPQKIYPSELRLALKRSQMALVYQPLFDIDKRRVIGCESLLRWNHHARGLINPNAFMSISEEAGITVDIGEWALHEVCRQMRDWRQQGLDIDYISINIEISQIADPSYPEMVLDALQRYKLPTSFLMLEISETLVLLHQTQVTQFVHTLSQMGIRFCVDGFGSSGKNTNYLKDLPVEALKLDHRLLMRVNATRQHIDLIQALTGIGDVLNKRVIAVGVERVRQEEVLQEVGCHFAQGFLYGKPMSADFFGKAYSNLSPTHPSRLN